MKTFILEFTGRTFPSEGIVYPIKEIVHADNFEAASLMLYDKY